jgi:site-specific DNA-methyltransferase (adenine-specific)/adenine-specific DNA-methyltransferase
MEPKIAREVTRERVRRLAEGYTNAKGEAVAGLGGGFRFATLRDETLFDETGHIRETVSFGELARHVYFTETGEPLAERMNDEGRRMKKDPSLLGVCRGVAIYLLYNGILEDKSANGGNVLTRATLAQLPPFDGPKVVYCAGCLLGRDRLARENITVRQTPYEVRVG